MKRICILQVEDTEEDVLLMEYAFKESGLAAMLRAVPHGRAAMDYISGGEQYEDRSRFPLPHLILLDWKLPGIGGLEVLQWIRNDSEQKNVPVIVLTSSAQTHDVEAAYSSGANAFITKPSGVLELIEMLRALNVFWLHFAQIPGAVAVAARQVA